MLKLKNKTQHTEKKKALPGIPAWMFSGGCKNCGSCWYCCGLNFISRRWVRNFGKENPIYYQKNEFLELTPMTLSSAGIPRMEVLGLSESLLTLSIIRLMVKIISRGAVAGKRTLKHPLTFGSWVVLQFQHILWLHQHKVGWVWWGARPNVSLAVKKKKKVSSWNSTEWLSFKLPFDIVCFDTWWESMSTKQKHLDPGVLPLTRRTFRSSRYAKGSKAFRIDSMVVVGFTFLIIIAVKNKHYICEIVEFVDSWWDAGLYTFAFSEDRGRGLWTLLRLTVAALHLCLLLTFFL